MQFQKEQAKKTSTMPEASETIHIRQGEINSDLSNKFLDLLPASIFTQLGPRASELSWYKSSAPSTPTPMPPGSIFLYAELTSPTKDPEQIGAVSVFPRHRGTPQGSGLPAGVEKAAEITRMIVLEGYQRRGVAMKLIRAAEEVAQRELRCNYLLVETGTLLEYAQKLYERAGYSRREVFGAYSDPEGRVYFEKWL